MPCQFFWLPPIGINHKPYFLIFRDDGDVAVVVFYNYHPKSGSALLIPALLSIPSIQPLLAQSGRWRLPVLSMLLVGLATSIWFGRSFIPAPV